MNVLEGLVCVTLMQTVPIHLETSHARATLATVGMDSYAQVSCACLYLSLASHTP